jgi:ribosomal protein S18 acetylase RimI-like enzyme
MSSSWDIKLASTDDFERWMAFVATVQDEFHGLDLVNDSNYRAAVSKNIERKTAAYVSESEAGPIIGAMILSPRSRHIGWLAVGKAHRHRGIGSALVRYAIDILGTDTPIHVSTFTETDPQGPAAHGFYRSLGFRPLRIEEDVDNLNAGKPFHLFEFP